MKSDERTDGLVGAWHRDPVPRASVRLITWGMVWPMHIFIAAQGHPMFVRSAPISGEPDAMSVNGQLQALKAGEIVLKSIAPVLHCRIRRLYDQVGPRLEAGLSTPWRADLAYLGLVPLALAARVFLLLFVPGTGPSVSALYRATLMV